WFMSAAPPPANELVRVTPAGEVTEITDFSPVLERINDQAVAPTAFLHHGHATEDGGDVVLVGINADGTVSFFALPTGVPESDGLARYWPASVVAHPSGTIWYSDNDGIARLTRDGALTRFPLPDAEDRAEELALGGDGNVWFLEDRISVSPGLGAFY